MTSARLGSCSQRTKGLSLPQPSSFSLPLSPPRTSPIVPTHRYCRCDSPVKALSPISVNLLELSNLERQRQN